MSDIFETETDEDEAELKELEDSDADGYEDYEDNLSDDNEYGLENYNFEHNFDIAY